MSALLLAVLAFQARTPGVTVQAWQLDRTFETYPRVVDGQIANAYFIAPQIDFRGKLPAEDGELAKRFYGQLTARLSVPESGTYRFELEAEAGAILTINNELVADTLDSNHRGTGRAEGQFKLRAGTANLRIRFLQNDGEFRLRLRWRPPSASAFAPIPPDRLTSEPGLTFVTAPGVKRADAGAPTTRPGDARPLEAVHPSFTLENFRGPNFQPAIGGMAFLPDGRLAVCTWDEQGAVYFIDGLKGRNARIKRFATGLAEPLGIAWFEGDLYVTQKGEITRLRDTDGDGEADEYAKVADNWRVSQNYHEFTFNLVPFQGAFHFTSSVPLRSGATNYMPGSHGAYSVSDGPGRWFRVDPKTGKVEVMGKGMRTPNGMNLGVDGRLFAADNQGTWVPASSLYVLEPGASYLHPETPDGKASVENVAVWFPHGEIGNSPSQMILIPDGPYRGQMLIGDVTHGGLKRIQLEKVDGKYQGAVYRHSQGLEAGVNRLIWGPDGSLYVGGVGSNGDWNHKGHKFGLQRLRPNGKVPFEIHELRAHPDGFEVRFTQPLPPGAEAALGKATARQWRYVPNLNYGGPKIDNVALEVGNARISGDRRSAFLPLAGLKPGHVAYLNLRGLKSANGEDMWSPEAWYTLNRLPASPFSAFEPPRGEPYANPPRGAERLIERGGKTRLVRAADGKPSTWRSDGDALAVVHDSKQSIGANDLATRSGHGDVFVHLEWFSPPGGDLSRQTNGNSGIKLQSRYEIQIMNQPGIVDRAKPAAKFNEAGSIYRLTAPLRNPSYGAGVWQSYDIWFRAAKFENGKKVANARVTVLWNGVPVHVDAEIQGKTGMSVEEAETLLPLLLQDHENRAEGPVQFRNVWWLKDPWAKGFLPPP